MIRAILLTCALLGSSVAMAQAMTGNPGVFGGRETTFNAPVTYGCETITYAASVAINMATKPCKLLTLTGDITLTTSGVAAGRNVVIIITGDGTARTLSLPAWKFGGGILEAKIGVNERLTIRLIPSGTTDASITANLEITPAAGLHSWVENPFGYVINPGTGNVASSTGLSCGFGADHAGLTPVDACVVQSSKGKLTLRTNLNGGSSGDLDIQAGGSTSCINLLDSSNNVRSSFKISSLGMEIFGKGGCTATTTPAMFFIDTGASTGRYVEVGGPAHAATELFWEDREDYFGGAQELWKQWGHGVLSMPTTTNGGIKTATCSAAAVTVDLAEPITNVITGGATCVVTVSPTSFGSAGINEDADFLFVVGDDPGGAHKVTFAGATSLIPTSCSTTGITKQGGTAKVHYSKVIGKFLFETCQDIL